MLRFFGILLALLLSACASSKIVPLQTRPILPEQSTFAFNGRVATLHDGERSSAGVRWSHQGIDDEILLLAPLGQTAARIHSDAAGVSLEASGKYYAALNAEALTEDVLGWRLPMAGLRYWVLALPAAGSQAEIERDTQGRVSVLRQDGWEIRYLRYATEEPNSLPLRLNLQRNGTEIKLFIDEWETQ